MRGAVTAVNILLECNRAVMHPRDTDWKTVFLIKVQLGKQGREDLFREYTEYKKFKKKKDFVVALDCTVGA